MGVPALLDLLDDRLVGRPRLVDLTVTYLDEFAFGAGPRPFGLALAPDGTLSVSGSFSNDVVSVDLTSLVVSPLVAAGAGAASQQAIGIAVFGGMALASTFGVILVPVLYVAMQAVREWVKGEYRGISTPGTTGPDAPIDDAQVPSS